jgi:hypothetical protein
LERLAITRSFVEEFLDLFGLPAKLPSRPEAVVVLALCVDAGSSSADEVGETSEPGSTRANLALVPGAKDRTKARDERDQKADEFKPLKQPGDDWTDESLIELLRQYEVLTASGPGAMKADSAHERLGTIWGYTASSVKTFLSTARGRRKAALAATPSGKARQG